MTGLFNQAGNPHWESQIASSGVEVPFSSNSIVRVLGVFSLVPIVVTFGLIAYFVRPAETLLVLHYNVYFGVDLLGAWWETYYLPVLGLIFFITHVFLAWHFYERSERIAAYLLLLASGFLSVSLLIASLCVIFINY